MAAGAYSVARAAGGGSNTVGDRYVVNQNDDVLRWARKTAKLNGSKVVAHWTMKDRRVVGATAEGGPLAVHLLNWHGKGGLEVRFDLVQEHGGVPVGNPLFLRRLDSESASESINACSAMYADLIEQLEQRPGTLPLLSSVIEHVWQRPEPTETNQKSQTRWKNRKDEITTIFQTSYEHNALGVLTAVNEWAQYGRVFRGSGGDESVNTDLRAEETMFGQTRAIGVAAYKFLTTTTRGET